MDSVTLKGEVTANWTDDEFLRFCLDNPDLRIERNSKLEIIIMSPTGSLSGKINTEILRQLSNWNYKEGKGEVFDSSSGFTLPDKSVFAPDACWVSNTKWNNLTEAEQNSFAPVCPEFVIEVRSKTDSKTELINKLNVWIENGCELAWLVDPIEKQVHIFHQGLKTKVVSGFEGTIDGQGLVAGFTLNLKLIKI